MVGGQVAGGLCSISMGVPIILGVSTSTGIKCRDMLGNLKLGYLLGKLDSPSRIVLADRLQ